MQTVLKEQIEEQRELLKKEIEEKMDTQKELRACKESLGKVKDGLKDVETITESMIKDARETQGNEQMMDFQSSQLKKTKDDSS